MNESIDNTFSHYIRLRDADDNGYITCIYCGKKIKWNQSVLCHYIKRRHEFTRWDEVNCNAGCQSCNNEDDLEKYASGIVKKWGALSLEKLISKKHISHKFLKHEKREIHEHYKKELKELLIKKGKI